MIITVARKGIQENTVVDNILRHQTGAININASRVGRGTGDVSSGPYGNVPVGYGLTGKRLSGKETPVLARDMSLSRFVSVTGRFPANVLLWRQVVILSELDRIQLQPGKGNYRRKHGAQQFFGQMGVTNYVDAPTGIVDAGGPSRFFIRVGD